MSRSFVVMLLTMLTFFIGSAQVEVEPYLPNLFEEMPYVRDLAMSKDGREIFFTVDDYRHTIGFIATSKLKRKKWSAPEIVSFSGRYRDIEPFLSDDGKRLYFASNRPAHQTGVGVKDYDLWYVDRDSKKKGAWSQPVRLPEPVNSEANEYYPSVTSNGDLYFTAERKGSVGAEDIFIAAFEEGHFSEPVSVKGGVNSESYEFNAFVAPDASYILYTSYRERDGRNRNDLYISRKTSDGAWGAAQLIPDIHSKAIDYCPFVDGQGRRLYFTSERNQVAASFTDPLDFQGFMDMVKNVPNGLGRIYSVDFGKVLKMLE